MKTPYSIRNSHNELLCRFHWQQSDLLFQPSPSSRHVPGLLQIQEWAQSDLKLNWFLGFESKYADTLLQDGFKPSIVQVVAQTLQQPAKFDTKPKQAAAARAVKVPDTDAKAEATKVSSEKKVRFRVIIDNQIRIIMGAITDFCKEFSVGWLKATVYATYGRIETTNYCQSCCQGRYSGSMF